MTTESGVDRAERYGKMAAHTRKLASRAGDPTIAAAYYRLAKGWEAMAHGFAHGTEFANDDGVEADRDEAAG